MQFTSDVIYNNNTTQRRHKALSVHQFVASILSIFLPFCFIFTVDLFRLYLSFFHGSNNNEKSISLLAIKRPSDTREGENKRNRV